MNKKGLKVKSQKRIIAALVAILLMLSIIPNYSDNNKVYAAGSGKTLNVNWSNIAAVGNQQQGSEACWCFALAYARTMLDGKVHSWAEYDEYGGSSQYNCAANIYKADFSRHVVYSANEVYKGLYDSINNNRPVIVNVSGYRTSDHFVCVVGYENVSNPNQLSASNFLIIDSCWFCSKSNAENMASAGYSALYDGGYHYYTPNSGSVSSTASDRTPVGYLDTVTCNSEGTITVTGWAYDPDKVTESIDVHIYIGGEPGSANAEGYAIKANRSRKDVDNAFHVGEFHGFSATLPVKKSGSQKVYAYGIDVTKFGNNQKLSDSGKTVNITADKKAPSIKNIKIDNITADSFQVSCDVSDNAGIAKVQFPVWTEQSGQDDIIWHNATLKDGHASFTVKRSDHKNEYGTYITHIYAWDVAGNCSSVAANKTTLSKEPVLQSITITKAPNKTEYIKGEQLDLTGMTVTANYTDKTTKNVTDYTVKGFENGNERTALTISYGGKSATQYITIHTPSANFEIETPATCTASGTKVIKCKDCEKILECESIPVTGHSWNNGIITANPTENTTGTKTYTCESCGETKTEEIPCLPSVSNNDTSKEDIYTDNSEPAKPEKTSIAPSTQFAEYNGYIFYTDDNGEIRCNAPDGNPVINDFKCDGTYTYYFQADGTAMRSRLTYHPDGEHIIYFDENGHEVFSDFANVKKTITGDSVNDYCFFDVYGYMYVDVLTYDKTGTFLYYANPCGVIEAGCFVQFSATVKWADGTPCEGIAGNYGYIKSDCTLLTNTKITDWAGRICYIQANGVIVY